MISNTTKPVMERVMLFPKAVQGMLGPALNAAGSR